uniref:Uncharacterized protein n=1 Tax=Anguilla anguilla TaxID=7936 RepID=A0A0E9W3E0_ANGAN
MWYQKWCRRFSAQNQRPLHVPNIIHHNNGSMLNR